MEVFPRSSLRVICVCAVFMASSIRPHPRAGPMLLSFKGDADWLSGGEMELRHLRTFLAVAEELSFRRAATKLHVTQPALSRQIRDLEEELGVELLVRAPKGIALSPAGQAFLPE